MSKLRASSQLLLNCALLATVALASGCGGGSATKSANVSGKVSYKGKALTVGTIELHGAASKVASSSIGPDGAFNIVDAPIGESVVVVRVPTPNPQAPPGMSGIPAGVTPVPVPFQYSDAKTSTAKQNVQAGTSKADIDLK